MRHKRLVLSHNKMIAGVCAGIAEYLEVDATLVRVFTVLFFPSLFVYFILWLIMPEY